jgi:hypothetical protein
MIALSRYIDVISCIRVYNQTYGSKKRRAQVREAQRSYQRRKDTASALEKKRADELLTLLSDLSTDVESLLQAASAAGSMHRADHVSKSIQRLWSTYDTVINNECIKPEMRLLQIKNRQRLATHQANASPTASNLPHAVTNVDAITNAGAVEDLETAELPRDTFVPFNPSAMRFDLVRFEGTTVMSSFQRTAATDSYMAGRNIFDIVKERQAAMKASDHQQNEQNSQDDR